MVQDVVVLTQQQIPDHLPNVVWRGRATRYHIIDTHNVLAGIYLV
jgi:hypothetical protein